MNARSFLVAGSLILAATSAHAQQQLLVGSTSTSSSHYGYFVAVANIINESVDGVDASVVETGATLDNIRRMERDQIDLGLVTTNVAQHAVAGTHEFEEGAADLQLLWVYTAVLNVMQLPVTQVPLGLDTKGLPLGLQVVGGHGQDHLTMSVAMELERAFGGWVRPPRLEAVRSLR